MMRAMFSVALSSISKKIEEQNRTKNKKDHCSILSEVPTCIEHSIGPI